MNANVRNGLVLAGFLAVVFAVAWWGTAFTNVARGEWFANLNKPGWNPPDWVFGPVWTVLYVLMAVAAWMVWKHGRRGVRLAMGLFAIQLALNAIWSPVFFGLQSPGGGVAVILPLWLMIIATTLAFCRVERIGGILMLPYLAWVSFAAVLNITIWRMNG